MYKILEYLQGKKAVTLTILALVNNYALAETLINENLSFLIGGILVALGYGGNAITRKGIELGKIKTKK